MGYEPLQRFNLMINLFSGKDTNESSALAGIDFEVAKVLLLIILSSKQVCIILTTYLIHFPIHSMKWADYIQGLQPCERTIIR